MRVVLIGKDSGMTLRTLDALAGRHLVVGIVESAPRAEAKRSALRRAADSVRRRWAPGPLRERAASSGARYTSLARGDAASLEALLREAAPDLLVITSLSHLLPASTFSIPPKGTINVHPSLLPRYPGPFPILWQYLENERAFGVTVHVVNAREDAGDVLEQEAFDVAPGTPLETVLSRAAAIGAHLTRKAVDDLEAGRAAPRPQDGPRGPRARAVRRDEPLVDWERWPIERVWHAMIGTSPWLDALRGVLRPPGPWRVGGYEVGDGAGEAGTVGRDARGWYASHPQGKIRLDVSSHGAA